MRSLPPCSTPGADVAAPKAIQTALLRKIADAMPGIGGENAGLPHPLEGNPGRSVGGLHIQAWPPTISGGPPEVRRNVMAKNVLGLAG